ncbi:MAG: hypothetical protein FJZ57_06355, partial [Chlamydiae bacterium]|nr:hypothetical protein [Chlamydiota bacterium]
MLTMDFLRMAVVRLNEVQINIMHKKFYANDVVFIKKYFDRFVSSPEARAVFGEDLDSLSSSLAEVYTISDITNKNELESKKLTTSILKVHDVFYMVMLSRLFKNHLPPESKQDLSRRLLSLLKPLSIDLTFSIMGKIQSWFPADIETVVVMAESFQSSQPNPLMIGYIFKILLDVPQSARRSLYNGACILCENISNLSCAYLLIDSLRRLPPDEMELKAGLFAPILSNVDDKKDLITLWSILNEIPSDKQPFIELASKLLSRGQSVKEKIEIINLMPNLDIERIPFLMKWEEIISLESPSMSSSCILQDLSMMNDQEISAAHEMLQSICKEQSPLRD